MSNLKILGWDKKPKTLYRYIKEGDIFAFQIKIDLFGWPYFGKKSIRRVRRDI